MGSKRKRQQCDLEEEHRKIARCAVDFQNQQSSRPCYQFIYQFDKEREWIKMGLSKQGRNHDADLDTTAYENCKARWVEIGLWDDDWTFLLGTSWRHERPQEYPFKRELIRNANDRKAAAMERAERPPRWYFMAPIFEDPPAPPLFHTNRSSDSPVSPRVPSDPTVPDRSVAKSEASTDPSSQSKPSGNSKSTDAPRSTRKSTVKTKPNTKAQTPEGPQAKSADKRLAEKPSRSKLLDVEVF